MLLVLRVYHIKSHGYSVAFYVVHPKRMPAEIAGDLCATRKRLANCTPNDRQIKTV